MANSIQVRRCGWCSIEKIDVSTAHPGNAAWHVRNMNGDPFIAYEVYERGHPVYIAEWDWDEFFSPDLYE